jgi:hypothetical protein
MMRRWVRFCAVLWLSSLAGGCTSKEPLKVTLEQSPSAYAAHYSTYAWRSAPATAVAPQPPSERTRRDWFIRATVDRVLAAKGYTPSSQAPDFLVDYELEENEKQTATFKEYVDYYRAGGSEDLIEAYTSGYLEGTLVLGIFDGSTRQLIWRTRATLFPGQKNSGTQIAEAVREMLARWPNQS